MTSAMNLRRTRAMARKELLHKRDELVAALTREAKAARDNKKLEART